MIHADVDRTRTAVDATLSTGQHAPTPRDPAPGSYGHPAPGSAGDSAPTTPPDREWDVDDPAAAELFGPEEDADDTEHFYNVVNDDIDMVVLEEIGVADDDGTVQDMGQPIEAPTVVAPVSPVPQWRLARRPSLLHFGRQRTPAPRAESTPCKRSSRGRPGAAGILGGHADHSLHIG